MAPETLQQAKNLEEQIQSLKVHQTKFDPKHKYVHLTLSDHHGNKGHTLQTYQTNPKIHSSTEGFSSTKFGEFLEAVQNHLLEEINKLEKKLEDL